MGSFAEQDSLRTCCQQTHYQHVFSDTEKFLITDVSEIELVSSSISQILYRTSTREPVVGVDAGSPVLAGIRTAFVAVQKLRQQRQSTVEFANLQLAE